MNGSQRESCCTDWAPAAPEYLSFPLAIKELEAASKLPHHAVPRLLAIRQRCCVVPSRWKAGVPVARRRPHGRLGRVARAV